MKRLRLIRMKVRLNPSLREATVKMTRGRRERKGRQRGQRREAERGERGRRRMEKGRGEEEKSCASVRKLVNNQLLGGGGVLFLQI